MEKIQECKIFCPPNICNLGHTFNEVLNLYIGYTVYTDKEYIPGYTVYTDKEYIPGYTVYTDKEYIPGTL